MNTNSESYLKRALIAFALVGSSLLTVPSQAVVVSPFTALYNKNINGQVVVTGNTNMTCPTSTDALGASVTDAEKSNCELARIRTVKSSLNLNNNAYRMIYTGAGTYGNKSMINSSTGNVTIPEGATIKSAFLFWHGDMSKPSVADGGKAYSDGVAKGCLTDSTYCRDQVWLITPKDTAAQAVTASSISSENPTSGIYRAHADITRTLTQIIDSKWTHSDGEKSITVRVGDIESAQGRDTQAGWSIIVAYAHPSEALRNLVIYGGLAKVAQNDPADVSLSGFQTPPSGNVTTTFGVVAAEGDASEGGDFLHLVSDSNTTVVSDSVNPPNNPANSTIAQNGVIQPFFNNTSGKYTNTFGTDADQMTLKNAIPNSATSATVRMGTNLETWYPIAFTMATELYSPNIQLTKVAVSTSDTTSVDPGDQITYQLHFNNSAGSGTAEDVVITDNLPANLTFVSTPSNGSSIVCTGSGQTFSCNIGDLTAGGHGYVEFVVAVGSGSGTIPNYATATYIGPLGSLEAISNVVTLEYSKYTEDLIAMVTTSEETITPGDSTDINVVIRNEGPAEETSYTVVIDVPTGTTVTPPTGCTQSGTTVTCTDAAATESTPSNGSLHAGEWDTIVLPVVTPSSGGAFEFTAEVTGTVAGGDAGALNNAKTLVLPSDKVVAKQSFKNRPANVKPKARPTTRGTKVNKAVAIDVAPLISDTNYDEMTLKFTKPSSKQGTVTLSGSTFNFKPKKNFTGTATFYYTVTDIRGAKASKTKITVIVSKSGKVTRSCFRYGC